jgi:hypothetical protein
VRMTVDALRQAGLTIPILTRCQGNVLPSGTAARSRTLAAPLPDPYLGRVFLGTAVTADARR